MNTYANLHIAFEQMRVKALGAMHGSPIEQGDGTNTDPPRILILGPENSGKSTICKIIANYAVRAGQGWAPMMVNVDTSQVCTLHAPYQPSS
jgi:polyribonucleotide 5'-hydroxyl-kinase